MSATNCLNCGTALHSRFCPDCGQKADTHRIVLKHFLLHDLLHGVWHLERGILFTLREAITRPGQAAMDYISGKRIRYYNVFYLCLLLIGFNLVVGHFFDSLGPGSETVKAANKTSQKLIDFFRENVKFIILGIVPIVSFSAFVIFQRLKLNLAEHFIIGGICLLGELFLEFTAKCWNFLDQQVWSGFNYGLLATSIVMALWPVWVYWNAAKSYYRWGGFTWRIVVFYLMILFLMFTSLTIILLAVAGNGNFEIDAR